MKNRKEQFEELAKIIRSKSIRYALDWSTSNYANSYQTALGTGVILITHNEEEYGAAGDKLPEFYLAFINERGQTIHSIEAYTPADPSYAMLKDIYESAYDSYMKTDDTYRSMMDAIIKK